MLESYPTADWETDNVQINCPECTGKAVIGSRASLSREVSDLYCSCKDPLCGATFVYKLTFSHTLSPSANQSKRMMLDMLKQMPANEQKELFSQLGAG